MSVNVGYTAARPVIGIDRAIMRYYGRELSGEQSRFDICTNFSRVMLCERGIATIMLSVCLSVMLGYHLGDFESNIPTKKHISLLRLSDHALTFKVFLPYLCFVVL